MHDLVLNQPVHSTDTAGHGIYPLPHAWNAIPNGTLGVYDDPFLSLLARRLQVLLHQPRAVELDYPTGRYPGKPRILSIDEIKQHLNGSRTFAFSACSAGRFGSHERRANFVALDIDDRFGSRLSVLGDVLDNMGLLASSFATVAPNRSRGKVIVTLGPDLPQSRAVDLGNLILRLIRNISEFQPIENAREVEYFPHLGKGGLCRILGRSPREEYGYEVPIDFCGALIDLSGIRPASVDRIRRLTSDASLRRKAPRGLSPRIVAFLARPWTREDPGGRSKVFARGLDVARDYLRVYGTDGAAHFFRSMGRVKKDSPALDEPSLTSKDRRHPLEPSALKGMWNLAVRTSCPWEPLDLSLFSIPQHVKTCYTMLVDIVRELGLMRHCFSKSSREVGDFLGVSHRTAQVWIRAAAEIGIIVIHDPGRPGHRGLPMLLGLVCADEDTAKVRELAKADPILQERQQEIDRLNSRCNPSPLLTRPDARG